VESVPPSLERQWAGFARRVLEGTSLGEKLRPLDPGEAAAVVGDLPLHPGRPPELRFERRTGREAMPTPRTLRTDRDRGRVLHAMANHELLALELFALALLRFPEIPPAHRRAIVRTMEDEQRHLAAYLDRLRATGSEVGMDPVSTFFWDALAPLSDPRSFVAGLSLCLEQANLDFARTWESAFRRLGDPGTADVLLDVYDDEIRHLRIGASTFRALRGAAAGPLGFDEFAAALVMPMSPARARGAAFDREGRLRAGLSADFVDRIATAGGSRGRVPWLYVLRPGAEDELAGRAAPALPELASLGMWMAGKEDLVWAEPPRPAFLAELVAAGFEVPAFVAPGGSLPRLGGVAPWATTPRLVAEFPDHLPPWDPRRVEVHGKAFAARCLRDFLPQAGIGLLPGDVGVVCTTEDEVGAVLGAGRWWIKADLSTAGGHRVCVDGPWAAVPEPARRFVSGALAAGPVVVERDLPVVAELSVHATVEPERVRVEGVTRFFAHRGVYRGTIVGPPNVGATPAVARFLHRDGQQRDAVVDELARAARFVGERARALGHAGPLSLDALVVGAGDDAAGYRLKPISEVNPRWTMSRIALGFRRELAPSTAGLWWFAPGPAVRAAAPQGLDVLLADVLPRVLTDGRLAQGVVATSDPEGAQLTTWLLVAPRWSSVESALQTLCARAPGLAAKLPQSW
jgi:uncharacterized ferritin-like protein (DUF455 family)